MSHKVVNKPRHHVTKLGKSCSTHTRQSATTKGSTSTSSTYQLVAAPSATMPQTLASSTSSAENHPVAPAMPATMAQTLAVSTSSAVNHDGTYRPNCERSETRATESGRKKESRYGVVLHPEPPAGRPRDFYKSLARSIQAERQFEHSVAPAMEAKTAQTALSSETKWEPTTHGTRHCMRNVCVEEPNDHDTTHHAEKSPSDCIDEGNRAVARWRKILSKSQPCADSLTQIFESRQIARSSYDFRPEDEQGVVCHDVVTTPSTQMRCLRAAARRSAQPWL